jgi:hypothetical protein
MVIYHSDMTQVNMAYPSQAERIQKEFNAPLHIVLPKVANESQTLTEACSKLGISYPTFLRLAKMVNFRCEYVADTPPEEVPPPAAQ